MNVNMAFNQFCKLLNLFIPKQGNARGSGRLAKSSSSIERLGIPVVCAGIFFKDNLDI